MRVTVLMENTSPETLRHEHGLSLHIEYGPRRLLLDAGSSPALLDNAEKLGVDLSLVDAAVLSHGHFDHSGGFPAFFEQNPSAPLYLHTGAEAPYFAGGGPSPKYIGVPEALLRHAGRLRYVAGAAQLEPGVWLLPHSTPGLEARGEAARLYRQGPDGLVPDDFGHEQSLVFSTQGGLVVMSSCSHAGADTVVEEVMAALPGRPVRAFLGGFHLMGPANVHSLGVSPEEVEALGRRLIGLGVEEIWTGHCTGVPAYQLLEPVLGPRLHRLTTGMTLELN